MAITLFDPDPMLGGQGAAATGWLLDAALMRTVDGFTVRPCFGDAAPGVMREGEGESQPPPVRGRIGFAARADGTVRRVRIGDAFSAHDQSVDADRRARWTQLGMTDQQADAILAGREAPVVRCLFVYGTLMRGELRNHYLARGRASFVGPARVAGALLDLGEYPGLVVPSGVQSSVLGEVYRFDDPELLAWLDEVEDFNGWDSARSLYHRTVVRAELLGGDGVLVPTWTYLYVSDLARFPTIETGDWRCRIG